MSRAHLNSLAVLVVAVAVAGCGHQASKGYACEVECEECRRLTIDCGKETDVTIDKPENPPSRRR